MKHGIKLLLKENLSYTKILQGPNEAFADFLARLGVTISHNAAVEEARVQLEKLLTFENANQECQRAIAPMHETRNVIDYSKACCNLGSKTQKMRPRAKTRSKMAATKRKRRGGLVVQAKKLKRDAKDGKLPAKPNDVSEEAAEEEKDHIPGPVCKGKWKNKERILIFSSRGINFRTRHLMQDLRMLMPHSKADTKMDRKDKLFVINEVCEMKNCNKCIYSEAKKKQDLYMWLSNSPH